MATIPYSRTNCKQCGGPIEYPTELTGQSIECPHCQQVTSLPTSSEPQQPAAVLATSPIPPLQASHYGEEDFFNSGGITVSRTRFVVDSQTFALANISSVRGVEAPPSRKLPIAILIFGVLLSFTTLWVGLPLSAISITWLILQKPTFSIVLTAAGGEVKAYSSKDRVFISQIIQALTEAIVARG